MTNTTTNKNSNINHTKEKEKAQPAKMSSRVMWKMSGKYIQPNDAPHIK